MPSATVAKADVTSGIVGYQQITVISGYSLFTPTFKNVDNTSFNLADVQPLRNDGSAFGTGLSTRCNGVIKVNKISAEGNYTTTYSYYETSAYLGWYDNNMVKVTADNPVSFSDGEAILVNNQYKGLPVRFQVSGAVDLVNKNLIPTGNGLFGNNTPVTINLADVVVLNKDGESFGTSFSTRCNGVVKVNKISAEGNYTTTYSYYETSTYLGWYDNNMTKVVGNAITIAPGEALLVNNQYKGQAVYFKLPSPVSE